MIWWALLPGRARAEQAAIEVLAERVDWLSSVSWKLGPPSITLTVEFDLNVGEQVVGLRMRYPDFFPDAPPSVTPRADIRLSDHQYGAGGELCLEHRADNWSPDITGAMMIESAYRLLSAGKGEEGHDVPNAHRTTLGQTTRSSIFRLVLTPAAVIGLFSIDRATPMNGAVLESFLGDAWSAQLFQLGPEDAPVWSSPSSKYPSARREDCMVLRLPEGVSLPARITSKNVAELFVVNGAREWWEGLKDFQTITCLLAADDEIRAIFLPAVKDGKRRPITYKTVYAPLSATRLPTGYANLAGKKVGIVGCGSVGSKIALSLARSGVRAFELIDGDLFLPGNIVRNSLDLRAIGIDKVAATRHLIRDIAPDAEVSCRTIEFGGQESSIVTSSAMSALGECALIIDASASADVFNLVATVARAARVPMVWGLVFAGGIGGLVARVRPDVDPEPLKARDQISQWYAARGVPWTIKPGEEYDGENGEETPLVAGDAEVSLIAAHMTRAAIDTLCAPEASIFPAQAYAIGFAAEWIFSAPFDVWPIELHPDGAWSAAEEEGREENLAALLEQLLPASTEPASGDAS